MGNPFSKRKKKVVVEEEEEEEEEEGVEEEEEKKTRVDEENNKREEIENRRMTSDNRINYTIYPDNDELRKIIKESSESLEYKEDEKEFNKNDNNVFLMAGKIWDKIKNSEEKAFLDDLKNKSRASVKICVISYRGASAPKDLKDKLKTICISSGGQYLESNEASDFKQKLRKALQTCDYVHKTKGHIVDFLEILQRTGKGSTEDIVHSLPIMESRLAVFHVTQLQQQLSPPPPPPPTLPPPPTPPPPPPPLPPPQHIHHEECFGEASGTASQPQPEIPCGDPQQPQVEVPAQQQPPPPPQQLDSHPVQAQSSGESFSYVLTRQALDVMAFFSPGIVNRPIQRIPSESNHRYVEQESSFSQDIVRCVGFALNFMQVNSGNSDSGFIPGSSGADSPSASESYDYTNYTSTRFPRSENRHMPSESSEPMEHSDYDSS